MDLFINITLSLNMFLFNSGLGDLEEVKILFNDVGLFSVITDLTLVDGVILLFIGLNILGLLIVLKI